MHNFFGEKMRVITIDGPAAAGKGTLGKQLAQRLGCFYLDSGLIYRQMAKWVLEAKVNLDDLHRVVATIDTNAHQFQWNDVDVELLRTEEISQVASKIGVLPEVRMISNSLQRSCLSQISGWSVVDGRDAGTVVFPDAEVKLFVTARADIRAERRYRQLRERGGQPDIKQIEIEMIQRDLRDQNREIAPLKPAPDAYIIDTSDDGVDVSLLRVLKYLEKYAVA